MPARWFRIQLGIAIALTLLSLAGQTAKFFFHHDTLLGFVRGFDIDLEDNVPSWWQSTSLALAGALAAVLSANTRLGRAGESGAWRWISAGLVLLSMDEALALHERLELPSRIVGPRPDLRAFTWLLAGIAIAAVAALFLRGLLRKLGYATARRLAAALAVYAAGVIGGEALSALAAWLFPQRGYGYVLVVHFEEFLEMLGVALVTWTMADHLKERLEGAAGQARAAL